MSILLLGEQLGQAGERPRPPASNDAQNIIVSSVEVLFHRKMEDGVKTLFFKRKAPPKIGISHPHEVYIIGLESAAGESWLELARFYSWRYVIFDGEEPFGVVEIRYYERDQKYGMSSIGGQDEAQATLDAVNQLEKVDDGKARTLRLLKIISIGVTAQWAHGVDGNSHDLFVLLLPLSAKTLSNPSKGYWLKSEFATLVTSMASRRLETGRNVTGGAARVTSESTGAKGILTGEGSKQ